MTGLAAGLNRTLRGDRAPSYVNAQLRTGIPILAGLVAGPYTDALPQARAAGNATITVDWKTLQPIQDTAGCIDACNGVELDLLVKLPSGTYIDPFSNTGSLLSAPFVKNPRDSFDDLQPLETIVIASAAANGLYRVVVDKFPFSATLFNPSWTNSQALCAALQWGDFDRHFLCRSPCGLRITAILARWQSHQEWCVIRV